MRALLAAAYSYFREREKESRFQIYASHAAFYMIVSSVPLLTLVLMLLSSITPEGAEGLIGRISQALPGQIADYLPVDFFKNALSASFPVVSLTALLMVWSSSKGLLAISEGLRSVYGEKGERSALRHYLLSLLHTVVFLAALVAALVLLVFGETIPGALFSQGGAGPAYAKAFSFAARLLSFPVFTLIFAVMYRFLPGKAAPFGKHLPGAAFASLGWFGYSWLLSLYLRFFRPEKYLLFGSMGALLLFLLWARFCMSIFMFGAELNVLLMRQVSFTSLKKKKGG